MEVLEIDLLGEVIIISSWPLFGFFVLIILFITLDL